ncbi:MAG: periplasmic heavy metal sensor [Ignavibacteria bacterium]|nr:periplasmic heavy metal sensor [Ignavibacteria bacterium]
MTRLFLLTLLACVISAATIAQPRRAMQPPMGGQRIMNFVNELNLTDAQMKEFQKLRDDSQKQMIALRAKKSTLGIELRELLRADAPDKGAVDKKLAEISQIDAQMRQQRINHWFAVNKTLTPDQQKVWKKALAAGKVRQQRGGMMMQRGMRDGMRLRMRMHQPTPW